MWPYAFEWGERVRMRGGRGRHGQVTPPAQLMGHADPRTTAIYTTVALTQLIAALDDAGLLE
jgi:hypothetical protein